MSLWRQRSAIERAIAGGLNAADEAKLRVHLAGCSDCRRHYDNLSMQQRILAGDPHGSPAQAERELARLMGALNPAPQQQDVPSWWPRFAMAAGVVAAVAFGFVCFRRPRPTEEIQLRGDGPGKPLALGLWLVAAPQDGGDLHSDTVFPSDASGLVRSTDWVAFKKKGASRLPFFRVVLVSEKGEAMVLEAGKSAALDPGRWRVFGVTDAQPLADEVLTAAAREAGVDGSVLKVTAAEQVTGLVVVEP